MRTIPYGRQHIAQEDIDAVVETLTSDFLTQGPKVKEFEDAFARYTGATYAVAVSNGTAALHLCAMALGVKPGSRVITSPITFAASANCVAYCGGEVAFADIDPKTYLLDIEKVRQLLRESAPGTYSGIIPVDFAGAAVNMEEFRKLADEFGCWIIEDACHAPGGYFTDSKGQTQHCGNGAYADLAIFSFHPVKHIATGEGGMITTNDKTLYDKLMLLRTHGITKDPARMHENHGGWYYEMQELGYNYRIPDMLCALGLTQLSRANEGLERRRAIAKKYDAAFAGIREIVAPFYNQGHAFHLYVIKVNDRLGLYNHLRSMGIFAQVHYIPVHRMPYYAAKGHKKGDYPAAEAYYEQCLSLPMYPSLSDVDLEFVIATITEYIKK